MPTDPRGYQALYARLSQCAELTDDCRIRLASCIQRAPFTYPATKELERALFLIQQADDIVHNHRRAVQGAALEEERRTTTDAEKIL